MTDYPVDMNVRPEVASFFDPSTNTISYVVTDPETRACAVIDSVMDIDYAAGRITHDHADQMSEITELLISIISYFEININDSCDIAAFWRPQWETCNTFVVAWLE